MPTMDFSGQNAVFSCNTQQCLNSWSLKVFKGITKHPEFSKTISMHDSDKKGNSSLEVAGTGTERGRRMGM